MTILADAWGIHPEQFWLRGHTPTRPVHFDPERGLWSVYGYREVTQVLGDPATFSSDTGRASGRKNMFSEGNITQMDPPRHTKVRRLVTHAFSTGVIADLAPRIAGLTKELLDAVAGQDRMELVADLAYPLPVIVIAELMGVPADDRDMFKHWVDNLLECTEQFTLTERDEDRQRWLKTGLEQSAHLMDYLAEHTAERRRRPRNDLLTHLVTANEDGVGLTEREVVTFAYILLLAGHITTTMLLGNTMVCLDTNPEQFARVRADRSLLPGAVEEALRLLSPFASVGRVTTRETELAGKRIPAGQLLMVWLGAANRDPSRFPDPHAFDPARTPNPHLGFGRGPHFCPGAGLARLEGTIALNLLLDRFPQIRTDPQRPPEFNRTPNTAGVHRLPLLLGAAD